MTVMKKIKDGIYKTNRNKIGFIDKSFIKSLEKDASTVASLRSRILYHSSTIIHLNKCLYVLIETQQFQCLCILFQRVFLLSMELLIIDFIKNLEILHDVRLSPAQLNGTFYVFIKKKFHIDFFL